MNVLFLTRATLYSVYGGDTVQIESTAKYLRRMGIAVDIRLANEQIDYNRYDLVHFFNITRPADFLPHICRSKRPYLVSTIFVDYSDYEATHRKGIIRAIGRVLGADGLEYVKAIARWMKNGEALNSVSYLLRGHKRSVAAVADRAAALLPNSESEYRRFMAKYPTSVRYYIVGNAIDPELFTFTEEQASGEREARQLICVSRIEGRKNQLNLIRAVNGTDFQLTLIGKPAPNHMAYYKECRRIAGDNIRFVDFVPQQELAHWYLKAKVHILPSWNETCGLSTMEAAYAGCNIVITDKGDTVDYFGDHAWYCDPADPLSIREAITAAAAAPVKAALRERIRAQYTWSETARQTLAAYHQVLGTEQGSMNR